MNVCFCRSVCICDVKMCLYPWGSVVVLFVYVCDNTVCACHHVCSYSVFVSCVMVCMY